MLPEQEKAIEKSSVQEYDDLTMAGPAKLAWRSTWLDQRAYNAVNHDWRPLRRGVKALLIYSDPMEDGYRKGDVFPHGPWGPESHIQRGAITYDFIVPGDPLTPGWPPWSGSGTTPWRPGC